LAELDDLGGLSELDVVEKRVGSMPLLAVREHVGSLEAALALMQSIEQACPQLRGRAPFTAVAHGELFDPEQLDLEMGYPVSRPQRVELGAGRAMTVRQLPAVERMACIIYVGSYEDAHRRALCVLAQWLERHRCELAGPSREVVHLHRTGAEPTI